MAASTAQSFEWRLLPVDRQRQLDVLELDAVRLPVGIDRLVASDLHELAQLAALAQNGLRRPLARTAGFFKIFLDRARHQLARLCASADWLWDGSAAACRSTMPSNDASLPALRSSSALISVSMSLRASRAGRLVSDNLLCAQQTHRRLQLCRRIAELV